MKFFKTIADNFRKYISIRGVATRSEFWIWMIFLSVLISITLIIDGAFIAPARDYLAFDQDAGSPLSLMVFLLLLPPTITAMIRRFHDSGKSAWWVLGCLLCVVLGFFVMGSVLSILPAAVKDAIGTITSPEILYLAGFLPLFYFLVKKAKKTENRYIDQLS